MMMHGFANPEKVCLYLVLERTVHGRSVEEGEVNNKRKGAGGGKNGEDKIEEKEEKKVYSFCLMVEASDHLYVFGGTYTCHTYYCYLSPVQTTILYRL
jgi:hypothetical protein